MYDPWIVDTFIRVHTQIVPAERASAFAPSLRAITEAAGTSSEPDISSSSLEEISASTDEMLTLFDLAKSLSPSMHIGDIADIISKHVRRLIPCSLSVFYLFEDKTDELVATYIAGEPVGIINGLRIRRGQRLSGWVAASRQTIRNSDPVLDFGESARSMSPRPRSCLSAALVDKSDLVGVLSLYSTNRDGFSLDHERVIEIVARQVAPVLRLAAEFESTKATSLRDQLTGLPNIEQFIKFSRSAEESSGVSAPAALLLIDLDPLNDANTAEEPAHDTTALSHVVDAIRRILRPTDVLFRNEDDAFIAVLLHTNETTGRILAERLRESISSADELIQIGDIRVSIAIALTPKDGRSLESLLAVAQRRLRLPEAGPERSPGDRIH